MFAKSLEIRQFRNIKVVSFTISNPASLGLKIQGLKNFEGVEAFEFTLKYTEYIL